MFYYAERKHVKRLLVCKNVISRILPNTKSKFESTTGVFNMTKVWIHLWYWRVKTMERWNKKEFYPWKKVKFQKPKQNIELINVRVFGVPPLYTG